MLQDNFTYYQGPGQVGTVADGGPVRTMRLKYAGTGSVSPGDPVKWGDAEDGPVASTGTAEDFGVVIVDPKDQQAADGTVSYSNGDVMTVLIQGAVYVKFATTINIADNIVWDATNSRFTKHASNAIKAKYIGKKQTTSNGQVEKLLVGLV